MDLSTGTQQIRKLNFADKHIDAILGGRKTLTYRITDDVPRTGERVQLIDESGERFASVHIADTGYITVEQAARENIDGHRTYRSTAELIDELEGYYPDEEITPETTLEIIYWDWEDLWE
ncbi:hypothetical protein C453_12756 [Haloferax elongans ATCC BAA-1513]|uniref:ASCH domain-containing protein n=1 Tax=Haloferax elongans ATCC BAA-1513 TaxID=1230453 RepID=M0HIU5_HALEO|nr:ASCH domain-containing protein [Haloferax elongans]ELZ84416.1 hypothetical protein C453_12756 [Haloferax elongans ATCC BAA-1513]